MAIDVTSLYDRRADNRWDRVCGADLVERVTWSAPDQAAIIGWEGAYSDQRFARLTYRDVDNLANQIANGLLAAGLVKGDRTVMVAENSVEAYVFRLGVAKAGLVFCPLNPALAPDVITHLLQRYAPTFCIGEAGLWPPVQAAFAAADLSIDVTIEIGGSTVQGSTSFADFVGAQPTTEPQVRIHGDDIWEIQSTSGTTAMPKGVMLSHNSATMAALGFALTLTRGVPRENDLVLVSFLPMIYHIANQPFGLSAFAAGGTLVLGRAPDPEGIAEAIEREHATALWGGSPAMYAALLAANRSTPRDLSSWRIGVYGWGALPPEVLDGLREYAPELTAVGILGQTESISCHRWWIDNNEELWRATSPAKNYVGVPSPMLASKVVDINGATLDDQPGSLGEAVYRSPAITSGYYLDEAETQTAFDGGWFHSGDSCVYDENGNRIMVDRIKDIVKSGGENVSTMRVESVLVQHPGVAKAAVIGTHDERWGEAVTAIVVRADPASCDAELTDVELIAFARERLAGFETPKIVAFVDKLPETVGGKVQKFRLRREFNAPNDQVNQ